MKNDDLVFDWIFSFFLTVASASALFVLAALNGCGAEHKPAQPIQFSQCASGMVPNTGADRAVNPCVAVK